MELVKNIVWVSVFYITIFSGNIYSQVYDLILEDMEIITYTEPFVAENSITATDFSVTGDGNVVFQAGNVITLLPGFSVTDGGEFHAFIADVKKDIEIPVTNPNVLSNFPNPFKNKTTINFSVHSAGNVKLTIINSIGQVIETLIDKNCQEGTQQQILFDATGLNSGIYFYKLETSDNTVIKKMVLQNS